MDPYPSQFKIFVLSPDTAIHEVIDLPASPTLDDQQADL